MSAEYLVRFDDLCPTTNWDTWNRVEEIVTAHDVRPLVAVVPDNQDPKLDAGSVNDDFWKRVRRWQSDGWTIAMHGYQHLYATDNAGICGLRAKSEFAGVPAERQAEMLDAGLAIFGEHRVRADGWIAPGHTFDWTTVSLLRERGVDLIIDGFDLRPHTDHLGSFWIPCQMWSFRPRRSGVWTVCLHTNSWSDADIDRFEADIRDKKAQLTDAASVRQRYAGRRRGIEDRAHTEYRRLRSRLGR